MDAEGNSSGEQLSSIGVNHKLREQAQAPGKTSPYRDNCPVFCPKGSTGMGAGLKGDRWQGNCQCSGLDKITVKGSGGRSEAGLDDELDVKDEGKEELRKIPRWLILLSPHLESQHLSILQHMVQKRPAP